MRERAAIGQDPLDLSERQPRPRYVIARAEIDHDIKRRVAEWHPARVGKD